jgi:tetratricopeptide (TPR) repeat protein
VNAAIADFSIVLERDRHEVGVYYWRATARAGGGDYAAALEDVDHYLQAHGDDADAYLLRARIEMGIGKRKEAQTDANDALRHYRIESDEAGAAEAQRFLDGLNASTSTESSHSP